jgi:hypothetical protein
MSIEALIQAHIQTLLENTEAVKLLTLSLAGRTPTAEKAKVDPKPKEEPNTEVKTEVKEEPKADPKDEDVSTLGVPYETVRALVLKLAPTQRDAIKALNAKHGIANLKVLLDKEDDFSTVNDQAKLEAVYADLQALEA